MELGEKIKKKIVESGIPIRTIAEQIGMSEANLHKMFKRDSVETKHLQKIASVLGISVAYFLVDDTDTLASEHSSILKDVGIMESEGQKSKLMESYVFALIKENREMKKIIESELFTQKSNNQ